MLTVGFHDWEQAKNDLKVDPTSGLHCTEGPFLRMLKRVLLSSPGEQREEKRICMLANVFLRSIAHSLFLPMPKCVSLPLPLTLLACVSICKRDHSSPPHEQRRRDGGGCLLSRHRARSDPNAKLRECPHYIVHPPINI